MKKNTINIVAFIAALLCIAAMFVPMGEFNMSFRNNSSLGALTFGIADFKYETGAKVITAYLIVDMVLLILWAVKSLKEPQKAGTMGLVSSIINLLLMALTVVLIIEIAVSPYFVGCGLVLAVDIVALIIAIVQKKKNKIVA